jgi:hypothetical protein
VALDNMTQWSTIKPYIKAFPAWAGAENEERLASYLLYEGMYWNEPEAFKLNQRGSDSNPIYIPAPRMVVDTIHRYLAPSLTIGVDPDTADESAAEDAMAILTPLLKREKFYARFATEKRFGLIRGNFAFILEGNPDLPEGARISIKPLDPGSLFPVYGEGPWSAHIIGWHIVDQIIQDDGSVIINRVTYRKTTGMGGPSEITVEEATFESDAWGGPDMDEKRIAIVRPVEALDSRITALPIYNFPNTDQAGAVWGSSELRGYERLFSAINQSISDEELELVLNGLGVYVTNAGSPQDPDTGADMPWNLGPAKVIELPGAGGENDTYFKRVTGTTTVAPHQEHLKYLKGWVNKGTGTPDVAVGDVDVTVAESGIALSLRMAPIFSRADDKQLIITAILQNMFHDLKAWIDVYEGGGIDEELEFIPIYGPRLPTNEAEAFDRLMTLAGIEGLVSMAWVRSELRKLGYEFPDGTEMMSQILTEKTALAQIEADVSGARMDTELDSGDEGGDAE